MKAYKALRGGTQSGYGGDQQHIDFFLVIPDAGIKVEYSQSDLAIMEIERERGQDAALSSRVRLSNRVRAIKLSDIDDFPSGNQFMKLKEMPLSNWAAYMQSQDTTRAEYAAVECEIPDSLVADLNSILQMEETKKRAELGLREVILGKPEQVAA